MPSLFTQFGAEGSNSRPDKGELVEGDRMRTDSIADMLTFIRNGLHARKERVDIPWSRLKEEIIKRMADEGFVKKDYSVLEEKGHRLLRIWLKYDPNGRPVLRGLRRASTPGLRTYVGVGEIPAVQNGLGVSVLSTSRGVLIDRQARKLHVGGEVLCYLW
jgi:small subunit ribosomal protein S8